MSVVERIRATPATAWAPLHDAKQWSRVDGDDEDSDFGRMIDAVALEAEDYAEIALFDQTVRLSLPHWPRVHVLLPIGPVRDPASIAVTIDGQPWTDLRISTGRRPILVMLGSPPSGAVVIEYQAGFGSTPADIPADIQHALLDQVAVYYDARGTGSGKSISLSPHFTRILQRYRGVRV